MKISFVIPCYRSSHTLPEVVEEIRETMLGRNRDDYEIILVNDSSPDSTFATIQTICKENSNVIGIDLARNFGQHAAIMAGLHFTTGEIVVCLDDDMQTPACEVYKLLDKIEEGYDVVYARYTQKQHSGFRNFGSKVNSKMTESLLNKPKELYISSYFEARRFVVEEMLQYKNAYPYVIGLVLRTTNRICNVDVTHRAREEGQSGYTLKKLFRLWVNGFTSFSVKPLRTATYCGMGVALLGFVFAVITIIRKLINPLVPMGWSSTMAAMLIIGGAILLVLGIIGEYIGRIYICMNSSPQYVIRSVLNAKEKDQVLEKEGL